MNGGVKKRATDALKAIAPGASAGLGRLANGTPLDSAIPKDLRAGTGNAFDKARRGV
jgi:hypothetical protein